MKTKAAIAMLDLAAARLRALSDPGSENCGVPAEHKEAVRLYVETWILPLVEDVLDAMTGKRPLENYQGTDALAARATYPRRPSESTDKAPPASPAPEAVTGTNMVARKETPEAQPAPAASAAPPIESTKTPLGSPPAYRTTVLLVPDELGLTLDEDCRPGVPPQSLLFDEDPNAPMITLPGVGWDHDTLRHFVRVHRAAYAHGLLDGRGALQAELRVLLGAADQAALAHPQGSEANK